MDFHSLTRRELQALCKKNNIPANTTNIAMANALKALDIVEGMEEFYNPSSAVSPGKTVMDSPYVPCTGGRTSTRKKTIKEESESVQITTRARKGTRKAVAGEVEDAKIGVAETPGNKSIRKRAPVASGVREMETPRNYKEDISVRKINTRRSTRLLEKKTMELNLNDKEGIEPIDFGDCDREVPNDMEGNVKEDSDDFGLNQETISVDDALMKTDEEALLDEVPDKLSDNVRELERVCEVLDESDLDSVSEEHAPRLTPKMVTDIDDGVDDANKDQNAAATVDDDDRAQTKLELGSEEYGESDIFPGENLEKSQDLKYEVPEEEDCDDSGCIDNTTEHLVFGNHEEGFNAGKDEGSKDSNDIMDPVVDNLVSEDSEKKEYGILSLRVSDASDQKQDIELQNQTISESEMKSVNDLDSLNGEDILKEGVVLADDAEVDFDHHGHSICYKQFGKEKDDESSQLVIESSYEVQPTNPPPVTENQICTKDIASFGCLMAGNQRTLSPCCLDKSEVQPTAVESNDEANPPPVTENQICTEDIASFGCFMAGNQRTLSPCCLDKSEVLVDMPFSTLAADPLQEQMMSSLLQLGSDSDSLICPPSLTLVKKSSNKIPTTSRKMNNFLDENKENIENSGMKLDLTKEKGKKDNNEAPDSIKNKSLRQLKKIYKERAQIKNKKHINEGKDFAQVGRGRPALQTLSENRFAASEPEIEI